MQINSELPDSDVVTLNADLNQATPMSGEKVPLVDLLFNVNSSLTAGTYTDAASLSPLYQLKPFADASNILIDSPIHYGFNGDVASGIPLRVNEPEVVGLVATTANSPLFDTASFQGTCHEFFLRSTCAHAFSAFFDQHGLHSEGMQSCSLQHLQLSFESLNGRFSLQVDHSLQPFNPFRSSRILMVVREYHQFLLQPLGSHVRRHNQ